MTESTAVQPRQSRTTVVIATHNRRDELLRTLTMLQHLEPTPPIIVVDNASRDGTANAVAHAHPEIRVIRAHRNLGAMARNLGVLCARTPYVAFSDDDSWWHAIAFSQLEHTFDDYPRVGAIAARTLVGEEERLDPVCESMNNSPLGSDDGLPGPRILGFTACATAVRRSAFLQVGGFNPILFFVAEERMLAYDLSAAGWELIYLPSVVAYHYPSRCRGKRADRESLESRNNALISWMRRPVSIAARDTVTLAKSAAARPSAFQATLGLMTRLPAALRQRHILPLWTERQVRQLDA